MLELLVSGSLTGGLDIYDLTQKRKLVLLWTVHTSVWMLQSDVVSIRQQPCCVTYTQHSVGSSTSRQRLCVKQLPSLSWKVSLSAFEKCLMCIYAFCGPVCLTVCLQACLPVCVSL